MRAASDVTADIPTPKHAACCNGCPVSVWGYNCSCSVAEPRLGLGRGGVIPTPPATVDKALGCKLRGMTERQQPPAKNIAHANDGGGMDPPPPVSALGCKGDAASHWESAILGLSELCNPWTDWIKIWHSW